MSRRKIMLTIGQLAKKTGLTVRSIRWYEENGIISPDAFNSSGHRLFDDDKIDWLFFVKHLRAAGLSVKEVHHYTQLILKGVETLPERLSILTKAEETTIAEIEEKQRQLEHIRFKKSRYELGENY